MSGINVKVDVHVSGRTLTAMRCVHDQLPIANAPPDDEPERAVAKAGDDGAQKLGELVSEVARYHPGASLPSEITITIYAGMNHVLSYVRPYKIRDLLEDTITLRDFVQLVIKETSDA